MMRWKVISLCLIWTRVLLKDLPKSRLMVSLDYEYKISKHLMYYLDLGKVIEEHYQCFPALRPHPTGGQFENWLDLILTFLLWAIEQINFLILKIIYKWHEKFRNGMKKLKLGHDIIKVWTHWISLCINHSIFCDVFAELNWLHISLLKIIRGQPFMKMLNCDLAA